MSDKSLEARCAASPHARTGFSLLLLLIGSAVSLLGGAGSQALGAQPSGLRAGVRPAQPKPARIDHAISRIRIETPEGVFLIYDAAIPPDTDDPSRAGRRGAGFLAYWDDHGLGQLFVFDRVLYTRADVGQALINLEWDLAIDGFAISSGDRELTRAVEHAVARPEDATTWTGATLDIIRSIMGFPDPDPGFTAAAPEPEPDCCLIGDPCCGAAAGEVPILRPPAPAPGAGLDEIIEGSMQALDCCPTGTPLPPCTPCCNSSDPCCGDPNPCCGSTDPCCGVPEGCCGSTDPCCGSIEPCCGDPNPCCGDPNPCCGSTDPCCGSSDPCCGDSNPCCGSTDPCCGDTNPCCGSTDPCCGVSDPCCGTEDPCCDDSDPCCGNSDPCCPVTNPCDPVCGDPCLCINCDDGNVCTDDSCANGVCSHAPHCGSGLNCCENGTCCAEVCNACINPGTLTGGIITVAQDPVCVGDSITFTASGVVDNGGTKRENCAEVPDPAVGPTYTWSLSVPAAFPPPLPALAGTGASVSVVTKAPGTYTATFTAAANRECPPPSLQLGSESGDAVEVQVESVTFSGASMSVIHRDDGSGPYPAPHWKDLSVPGDNDNNDVDDHDIPVAFVRGTRMSLSATFKVNPPDGLSGTVTVKGTASAPGGPYVFETTAAAGGGTITITDVAADKLLVDQIDYFDPMTIAWTITPEAGDPLSCDPLPTSHRVYVTLGAPIAGTTLFETVVHLGCKNAGTLSTEADVIAGIWNDFTDRKVFRKPADGFNNLDGVQLKYWNPPSSSCQTMEAMLAQSIGNGTCIAWSRVLQQTIAAQGIAGAVVFELTPIYSDDAVLGGGRGVMLVKNWSFLSIGTAPPSCAPFTHLSSETTDSVGAPGQGNGDPPGGFFNHFIVAYAGSYYDPSYGAGPFLSQQEWENASIDGYKKACESLPGDVRKINNTTLLEMHFIGP